MCFGSDDDDSAPPRPLQEYDLEYLQIRRRASSVKRHLDNGPAVKVGYNGARYPHKYHNRNGPNAPLFPPGSFYEYPTKDFPYHLQNAKGKIRTPSGNHFLGPAEERAMKGHTRTITDRNKSLQGVIYHHDAGSNAFMRAREIREPKGPWKW
ncbi:hypothetical protein QBC33DRAFT_561024 [Phialemonium atrogriseum]|uniref:Uncharacterized protein n=1 Tax=Phialemonium atrogriseum TaxID=1093897 RepID=A0AAJ0BY36_9PEZI|nr:uncharacterized protein QBC33DRAFT_561024 [Phialemonium atrogriseum]KAK1765202.1 hypothetical protein QBC33DRAFT_561024 [Phialemonium atrogriseum]